MRRISDSLGFLISDVSRLMRRRFDERARLVGATRAQWKTLVTLSRNEGINQGGLADLLEVEPITLCRMVDRLEESGMVERRREPADRRAWQIFLTDAAKPVLEQLRAHADEMFGAAFAGLDDTDRTNLTAALERVRTNLTDMPKDAAHG
ncbi:MarR family transcriptional regulator [Roseomonas aeriglobus]|nr:MarR family transcriptional regulator [Roseomonas aeriglobus]